MKIEDFEKASRLVSKIEAIKDLTKEHTLGRASDTTSFEENNNDFYNANFINVFETKGYHNTGGGSCTPCRLTVAKYKDMSGSKYELTKQETIKLQEFLKNLLDERLEALETELSTI